jgi:hypothetical protein
VSYRVRCPEASSGSGGSGAPARAVDCAENPVEDAGRDRRQRIDGQRRPAHRSVDAVGDAEDALVLPAAENEADERDLGQDRVDLIGRNEGPADVDGIVFEIDNALGGYPHCWIVYDRVLDGELARRSHERGRHLLKPRDRRIDGRGAVLRLTWPAGRDEFTKRRFVTQHEVCHRRLGCARPALRSHDQVEVAALQARIEIGEAEERAGVVRREPQFAPGPAPDHRADPDLSAHGPEPRLAAAAEGRQVQILDRLLVGPDDVGDLEVDIEVLALGWRRRAPVDQRFDEGPRVQRGSAHRNFERGWTVDNIDREIVARRDARLRDLGALHRAVGADFG